MLHFSMLDTANGIAEIRHQVKIKPYYYYQHVNNIVLIVFHRIYVQYYQRIN